MIIKCTNKSNKSILVVAPDMPNAAGYCIRSNFVHSLVDLEFCDVTADYTAWHEPEKFIEPINEIGELVKCVEYGQTYWKVFKN